MPRPKANVVVLDPGSGKARPGAWVTFYDANTLTKTTLYADDDISTLANPVQANGLGQVAVRLNPGLYDVSMTWDGAQPTVVEDVLAWTPETAVLTNPGDMLVIGTDGKAARLAIGAPNQVLMASPAGTGLPEWRLLAGGQGLPSGPNGVLLTYGTGGSLVTVLPGLQDQALAMQGGMPEWVSTLLPPGTTLPINQPGDLVVGAVTTGLPARLAKGNTGDMLTVNDAGGLSWRVGGEVGWGRGDCYLDYLSPTEIRLQRLKGSELWVNGGSRTIPEGGVLLERTGLTVNTTYYVYAAWVSNTMVLEASTTQPVWFQGLVCKTGDASRTLVGLVHTYYTAVEWRDTPKERFVLSYFNPSVRLSEGYFSAPRSTTSTSTVEVHDEIRASFLTWGDLQPTQFSAMEISLDGHVFMPSISACTTYLGLDGVMVSGVHLNNQTPNPYQASVGQSRVINPSSAGWHFISLYGVSAQGHAHEWTGDVNNILATRVLAGIWG